MLKGLTQEYITHYKDIHALSAMLADDFSLKDPVVLEIKGKQASLEAISNIFGSCEYLSFDAKNIYQEGNVSLIEFVLRLDAVCLEGVDIIQWDKNHKISALRAYLYEVNNG